MADKNLKYLKKAVYSKLSGDATLVGLLGGSGRIFHKSPAKDASYPCITYEVISDVDNVFNEDIPDGKVTKAMVRVRIFSRSSTTEQSDDMECRIKTLLHGQRTLDTSEVICYNCYRDALMEPMRDPETLTRITLVRYKVTWGVKQ